MLLFEFEKRINLHVCEKNNIIVIKLHCENKKKNDNAVILS